MPLNWEAALCIVGAGMLYVAWWCFEWKQLDTLDEGLWDSGEESVVTDGR